MARFETCNPSVKYILINQIEDVHCRGDGCHRVIFQIQGDNLLIQCKRCKKTHRIIYDKKDDCFKIVS